MATYAEVTPDVLGIAAEIVSHHHPALLDAKIGFIGLSMDQVRTCVL